MPSVTVEQMAQCNCGFEISTQSSGNYKNLNLRSVAINKKPNVRHLVHQLYAQYVV